MDVVMPTNDRLWEGGDEASTAHGIVPSFGNGVAVLPLGTTIFYGYEAMSKLVIETFYHTSNLTASGIRVSMGEASLVEFGR